ncbi:MAG: putative metalloprotease with PDZ domain [Cyclobacteriaceae bacterium]|jgi:predicted metalloprotease with PDZ domain
MKILFAVLAILSVDVINAQKLPTMVYEIDLSQNLDTFFVSLKPEGKLPKSSNIYQFAATAPGTYQTMNVGRLVSDFKALDKKGRELNVSRISMNQFTIDQPNKISIITYKVAETFDTQLTELPIYMMAGSSIEMDHGLINTHTMVGYFEGYQKSPIKIKTIGQKGWETGTALKKEGDYFIAEDFDEAVDSPILMGNLSFADTVIADTKVEIYTYAFSGQINSKMLMANMSGMLDATRKFLVTLPVDHYTFLYFFEPNLLGQTGAWEHSYSSEYVLTEEEPTDDFMGRVTDIASHEFFHIVTPLNIHSEIVESFNFVEPTTSIHLWMYEGVTEWASHMLQFRGGMVDLDEYIETALNHKMVVSDSYFDSSWSLKKISDESFKGGEGAKQYGNIYYKGSLVASLLDIRLLELSDGKYGLRELIIELIAKYGKGNPVSEQNFFDDIAQLSFSEIREFFTLYVLESNPLPFEEYFAKIGLSFEPDEFGREKVSKMKNMTPEQQKLYEAWSRNM